MDSKKGKKWLYESHERHSKIGFSALVNPENLLSPMYIYVNVAAMKIIHPNDQFMAAEPGLNLNR